MSMLTAFDAVVSRGSVSDAARALALSQSTVSRLVQALEEQMGRPLFTRQRKRLVPTPAALAYHERVARGLDLIQQGAMGLIANPGGGSLSLAVLPTLGTRWLAPRLAAFFAVEPGVSISLATKIGRFDFDAEPFHAVIYFGVPNWPGLRHLKIFDERYTACASPAFVAAHGIAGAGDVGDQPLLILQSRADAQWNDWFAGQGMGGRAVSGMVVDQFSMMIQAAVSGLGIALLPQYLAEVEVGEGRLVPIGRPAVAGTGSYWLAWPERNDRFPPLAAFRAWLTERAAASPRSADPDNG